MPQNINLLLDVLQVDPDYVPSQGNTEPNVLHGLFGLLQFRPWKDFNKLITEAIEVVEGFEEAQLQAADELMQAVRKSISAKKKEHNDIEQVEERKKSSMGHQEVPLLTFRDEEVEGSRKSKKRKTRPGYMRKPVTSSTSIAGLHSNVMDALHVIVKLMYPEEVLSMDQRLMTSEFIIEGTDVYSSCASEPGDEPEDAEGGDEPRAMEQCIDICDESHLANFEDRPHRHDDSSSSEGPVHDSTETANIARPNAESDIEGTSVGPRRSLRLAAKRGGEKASTETAVETNAIIKLRQTPDKALIRYSEHSNPNVPVCAFEFKGPTVDLSGLLDGVTMTPVKSLEPRDTGANNMNAGRGQNAVDATGATSPNLADASEIENPVNEDAGIYLSGASADEVAAEFARMFSNVTNLARNVEDSLASRAVLLPIAQVICQAILTQSGCAVLTNHQTAIAFRVEECARSKTAQVFVTGAIPCHQDPGNVAAMLAIAKFSLDKVIGKDLNELLGPNRRLLRRISHAHYKNFSKLFSSQKQLDKEWNPGHDDVDSDSGARNSQGASHIEETSWSLQYGSASGAGGAASAMDHRVKSRRSSSPYKMSGRKANSQLFGPPDLEGDQKFLLQRRRSTKSIMDENIRRMFATTDGVIAVGGSGLVLRGFWGNMRVAVKIWNGQSAQGFLDIRREIKIFKALQKRCSSILGDAVPRLLLGWDHPEKFSVYRKEVILVTEMVGQEIARCDDGFLLVGSTGGYEEMDDTDEQLICEAALRSLEKLHSNRFMHGDIALRNLRVEERTTDSHPNWNAWWVDLGNAVEVASTADPSCFQVEMRKCRNLFHV